MQWSTDIRQIRAAIFDQAFLARTQVSRGKIMRKRCFRSSAGSRTMPSPMRVIGQRFNRPTRRGGRTTTSSIITLTVSARTDGTVLLTCYVAYWDVPTQKRCFLVCCMRHNLPATSISTGMFTSKTGASLAKMVSQVHRSPFGCTKERSGLNTRPRRSPNILSLSPPITSRSKR